MSMHGLPCLGCTVLVDPVRPGCCVQALGTVVQAQGLLEEHAWEVVRASSARSYCDAQPIEPVRVKELGLQVLHVLLGSNQFTSC